MNSQIQMEKPNTQVLFEDRNEYHTILTQMEVVRKHIRVFVEQLSELDKQKRNIEQRHNVKNDKENITHTN